ncbi:uncharacterized protein [Penaeus vannamei]|uniref:uncharacterized protein n=1 Tax=Penaeus vannamei TaxID=6689 RepID=UPI00387F81EE
MDGKAKYTHDIRDNVSVHAALKHSQNGGKRLGSERFKDGRTSPPTSRLLYPAYALNKVVDAGQAPEVCQPSATKGRVPKVGQSSPKDSFGHHENHGVCPRPRRRCARGFGRKGRGKEEQG